MSVVYSLGGASSPMDFTKEKQSIDSISGSMKKFWIQMSNLSLPEGKRVLALKKFEEGRSALEDTAKNYPVAQVRQYALERAREVLAWTQKLR